jgi:hypothetical protein
VGAAPGRPLFRFADSFAAGRERAQRGLQSPARRRSQLTWRTSVRGTTSPLAEFRTAIWRSGGRRLHGRTVGVISGRRVGAPCRGRSERPSSSPPPLGRARPRSGAPSLATGRCARSERRTMPAGSRPGRSRPLTLRARAAGSLPPGRSPLLTSFHHGDAEPRLFRRELLVTCAAAVHVHLQNLVDLLFTGRVAV